MFAERGGKRSTSLSRFGTLQKPRGQESSWNPHLVRQQIFELRGKVPLQHQLLVFPVGALKNKKGETDGETNQRVGYLFTRRGNAAVTTTTYGTRKIHPRYHLCIILCRANQPGEEGSRVCFNFSINQTTTGKRVKMAVGVQRSTIIVALLVSPARGERQEERAGAWQPRFAQKVGRHDNKPYRNNCDTKNKNLPSAHLQ